MHSKPTLVGGQNRGWPCLANIASRLNALEADTANLRADNANLWADNANLREDNANLRTTLQGHAYEIYLLR